VADMVTAVRTGFDQVAAKLVIAIGELIRKQNEPKS